VWAATDWIAAAQAAFLAVAAWFAWRGYVVAAEDRRREPLRRLLLDVVTELKELALATDPQLMRRRQRSMLIALGFIPQGALTADLLHTRQLAEMSISLGSDLLGNIERATQELADALHTLDAQRGSRLHFRRRLRA
jgi:HAMP domain-containing protein